MNTGPCGGVGVALCQVGDVPSHSVTDAHRRVGGQVDVSVVVERRLPQRLDVARECEGADLERGVEDSVDDDVWRQLYKNGSSRKIDYLFSRE